RGEFLRHLFQTRAPCPSREFPHPLLTPEQSLGRDAPFRFSSAGKAEAQKLSLLRSCHRALRLIHLELESPPEEARHALHDSLPRTLARYVDIAIIRVAHETVLASLQLPVEFVEHEVRQQWRQRPSLRSAFLHRTHHPVLHHPRLQKRSISLSILLSFTRRAIAAISLSWLTRSKNFSKSRSTTQRFPSAIYCCALATA